MITALLLLACSGGLGDPDAPTCDQPCPEGTRKSTFEAVLRGEAGVAVGASCESYCEPITTCLAPQVPVITGDTYACASVEGISSITPDDAVDFSFTDAWAY